MKNFDNLEQTSLWSFPEHGNWASHDSKYRGNWSPHVPRNLILRYSKPDEIVLDQFVGGGTTIVEALLLNRIPIGIDINDKPLKITRNKLNFKTINTNKVYLRKGDARNLVDIPNDSIDLICTHPPYANIIQYSKKNSNDLSHLKPKDFLVELKKVATESYRVLKHGKYCTIMIGDARKNGKLYPLGLQTLQIFQEVGFNLKEIIIKQQHNARGTKRWENNHSDFLLLAHEYIFVFKKWKYDAIFCNPESR